MIRFGSHPILEPVAVPGAVLLDTGLLPFPGWAEKWVPPEKKKKISGASNRTPLPASLSSIVFSSLTGSFLL